MHLPFASAVLFGAHQVIADPSPILAHASRRILVEAQRVLPIRSVPLDLQVAMPLEFRSRQSTFWNNESQLAELRGYWSMEKAPSGSHTRPSLLLRIRDARDNEAWTRFVDVYGPMIHRYCRRQGLQDADAANVTQEVLLKVTRSIQGFEYQPERGRFRGWLFTVTQHEIIRQSERATRYGRGEGGTDELPPMANAESRREDSVFTEEFNAQIFRAALDAVRPHFEPQTWRAFELVWLKDRSPAEVAREVSMPEAQVYQAKSRVLKRLREEVLMLAEDVALFGSLKSE